MPLNLMDMKDIPSPRIELNFGPETMKSLVIGTFLKILYEQKRHLGPSKVN